MQVYVIGGDGSMRAANILFEAVKSKVRNTAAALHCHVPLFWSSSGVVTSQELPIAVAGVPKTIDNDIGLIDRCVCRSSRVLYMRCAECDWSAVDVVLCCAVLCCAVLCCAVLCCAVLCCAVLCCAVLCCV
jgi:hypothetical protein